MFETIAKTDEFIYEKPQLTLVSGIVFTSIVAQILNVVDPTYTSTTIQLLVVSISLTVAVPLWRYRRGNEYSYFSQTYKRIQSKKPSTRTGQQEKFTQIFERSRNYSRYTVILAGTILSIVVVDQIVTYSIVAIAVSLLPIYVLILLYSSVYNISLKRTKQYM